MPSSLFLPAHVEADGHKESPRFQSIKDISQPSLDDDQSFALHHPKHVMTGSIVLTPVYNKGGRGKGNGERGKGNGGKGEGGRAMDRKDRWPMAEVKFER